MFKLNIKTSDRSDFDPCLCWPGSVWVFSETADLWFSHTTVAVLWTEMFLIDWRGQTQKGYSNSDKHSFTTVVSSKASRNEQHTQCWGGCLYNRRGPRWLPKANENRNLRLHCGHKLTRTARKCSRVRWMTWQNKNLLSTAQIHGPNLHCVNSPSCWWTMVDQSLKGNILLSP